MTLLIWLSLWGSLVAQAAPLSRDESILVRGNENIHIVTGESATDRTIFTVVSIFCSTVLAFLLGKPMFGHCVNFELTVLQAPEYID